MSHRADEEAWQALLAVAAGLGQVELRDRGFDLRFVDDAGRAPEIAVLVSPEEWMTYLWDWTEDDAALKEVARVLRASAPEARALMVREYKLLLAPYVPRL